MASRKKATSPDGAPSADVQAKVRTRAKLRKGTMSPQVQEALKSWAQLNKQLRTLSEDELQQAIIAEKTSDKPRKDVVLRLVRRYQRLCRDRQRAELLA